MRRRGGPPPDRRHAPAIAPLGGWPREPANWWELAPWAVVAAWVYLLVGRAGFWFAGVRLPEVPEPGHWPSVGVVVPARNEAELLGTTLASLVAQDYPGSVHVVLVDDASTDATAETARAVGSAGTVPLSILAGAERPKGWTGKLWALHQGVQYATSGMAVGPAPEWLLLSDADIVHPSDSLRRLVAAAIDGRRDMVSLMARLRVVTRWERLLIPSFVYFFSQLYPFRRVASPGRTAAAAGGCILVRASALSGIGGAESIREAIIDDVALARRLKRQGGSIWLGLADEVYSARPYPGLEDLWRMVVRSAFTQLHYSSTLLVGTLVGLAALYLGPLAAFGAGLATANAGLIAAGGLGWGLMTVTYLPTVRYYGLRRAWALTLPGAAAIYGAMTADSARRHWQGHGVDWKGRQYG